jgi:hypothetical protein
MNIKFNYVSLQNGTMIYILDFVDHSWTMGLNFGGTMLCQSNLISAKGRTPSSPNPHQNC